MSIERGLRMDTVKEYIPPNVNERVVENPRQLSESTPISDAPLYTHQKFQNIANLTLRNLNVPTGINKDWGDLKSAFDSLAPSDNSPQAEEIRDSFTKATFTSELFIRKLLESQDPDVVTKQLQSDFQKVVIDLTKQALDPTEIASQLKIDDPNQLAEITQLLERQDGKDGLSLDFRNDANFRFAKYMARYSPNVAKSYKQLELMEGTVDPDDLNSFRDTLDFMVEGMGNHVFAHKFTDKADYYNRKWIYTLATDNPVSDDFWQDIDPNEANSLKESLRRDINNPELINRYLNSIWADLPDVTRMDHMGLKELLEARITVKAPPERLQVDESRQINNQRGYARLPRGDFGIPESWPQNWTEKLHDPSTPIDELKAVLKNQGSSEADFRAQMLRLNAEARDRLQQDPSFDRDKFIRESLISSIWQNSLAARLPGLAAYIDEIPRKKIGEEPDEYKARVNQYLSRIENDPYKDRATASVMEEMQKHTFQWSINRINAMIYDVADKNEDWNENNFNPIQQMIQALKFVTLQEERTILDRFAKHHDKVLRDRELDEIARKKDDFINLTLTKINMHNVRRMIISNTVEKSVQTMLGFKTHQLQLMMDEAGFAKARNDLQDFQGAWYRGEEVYTPDGTKKVFAKVGQPVNPNDFLTIQRDTDFRNEVEKEFTNDKALWMTRKRIDLMKEYLVDLDDPERSEDSPTRKDILNSFVLQNDPNPQENQNFGIFMTKVLLKDTKNKAAYLLSKEQRLRPVALVESTLDEYLSDPANIAVAESIYGPGVKVDELNEAQLRRRQDYIDNLSAMVVESFERYDLAYKSDMVSLDVFKYDGSKWNETAYKRELERYNQKRQKKGLQPVSYMPNFAYMDDVRLGMDVHDPKTGEKLSNLPPELGQINLAALESCQVYVERIYEKLNHKKFVYKQQFAEYTRDKKNYDEKKRRYEVEHRNIPNHPPFSEPEPTPPAEPNLSPTHASNTDAHIYAREKVRGQEPLEYWVAGDPNDPDDDGHFDWAKYQRHYDMVSSIKGDAETYNIVESWSIAKRNWVRKHKFDINVSDSIGRPEYQRDAQGNFILNDKGERILQLDANGMPVAPTKEGLFSRSLKGGQGETLFRRLLNLSTHYRRQQGANAIALDEILELGEMGGETMMHCTGRLSTRDQFENFDTGDMSNLISIWSKRIGGVEKIRGALVDDPPIFLLSTGSVRQNMVKTLDEIQKNQGYMSWNEKNNYYVMGLEEFMDFNMKEIRNDPGRAKEWTFMTINEAKSQLITAYLENQIAIGQFNDLESRQMMHWMLYEIAAAFHKTQARSATWATFLAILKAVFK